ncbi:uncharacterized protein [Ptychodera flava]|uniref:uncharacterized protein n=1 Tax=Ptychodera flava TaxID=63121 RepID=UPI00396A4ECC
MVSVTIEIGGADTYTFLEDHSVLVNDRLVESRNITISDDKGSIQADEDSVVLYFKEAGLSLEWTGKDHEALVTIDTDDLAGRLCGLFGDGSRVQGDDLLKSDGTRTTNTTEFAESWVVPGR